MRDRRTAWLEEAVTAFRAALQELTRERVPRDKSIVELRREASGAERNECPRLTAWDCHTTGIRFRRITSRFWRIAVSIRSSFEPHKRSALQIQRHNVSSALRPCDHLFYLGLLDFQRTAVVAIG
jgi:hypothetical protein